MEPLPLNTYWSGVIAVFVFPNVSKSGVYMLKAMEPKALEGRSFLVWFSVRSPGLSYEQFTHGFTFAIHVTHVAVLTNG